MPFRPGWRYNSIDFYWKKNALPNHKPIFRAWNGSDHLYTTDENEYNNLPSSYNKDGIAGYVGRNQLPGHVPLYRLHDSLTDDTILTIDEEYVNRFCPPLQNIGIIGYVMPHTQPMPRLFDRDHVPVYFAYSITSGDSLYTTSIEELLIQGYDVYPLFEKFTIDMDVTVNKNVSGTIITYPQNGSLKWKTYDEGINYTYFKHFVVQLFVELKETDDEEFLPPNQIRLRLYKPKPSISDPATIPNPPAGEGGVGQDIIRGSGHDTEDTTLYRHWVSAYWELANGSHVDVTYEQDDEPWNTTWPHVPTEGIRPRTVCIARPRYAYETICPINWCIRVANILDDYTLQYYMVLFEVKRPKRFKQFAIPFMVKRNPPIRKLYARPYLPRYERRGQVPFIIREGDPWKKFSSKDDDGKEEKLKTDRISTR